MRKTALLLTLTLLLAPQAWADTLAVGNRLLNNGDSTGKVYELLGKPDRIVGNENGVGAVERFEYYRDGRTTLIELRNGIVQSISVES